MDSPEQNSDRRTRAQRWRSRWAERTNQLGRASSPAVGRAERVAVAQGFVLTVAQAQMAGLTSAEVRSLVRRRIWSVPRRATLAVVGVDLDRDDRVALAAAAAVLTVPGSVVSHESAAILWGLPVVRTPARPVLTFAPGRYGRLGGAGLHRAGLEPDEVAAWHGVAATTVARTVTDIARTHRWSGLVVADAVLAEGLSDERAFWAAVARGAGWPGNRSARWVAEHAHRLSESPLESLVRACLITGGLPAPELQVWIPAANARVDLLYREHMLVIEADGMLKYDAGPSVLREEKRREERLVRAGYRVERVLYDDVFGDPAGTVARIEQALARSALTALSPLQGR